MERDEMMHRARAALAWPNVERESDTAVDVAAFMDIFFPNHPAKDKLVREVRQEREKKRRQ